MTVIPVISTSNNIINKIYAWNGTRTLIKKYLSVYNIAELSGYFIVYRCFQEAQPSVSVRPKAPQRKTVPKAEADRLRALISNRQRRVEESEDSDELETSGGDCTVPDKIHREVLEERNR